MKRLIVDLDGTITFDSPNGYAPAWPNHAVIERLREHQKQGFEIVVHTSRNVNIYKGSVEKINAHTLPIIIDWLQKNDVPFDEIYVGKPWCGTEGFYIDDRAIRPSESSSMTYTELVQRVEDERARRKCS